ncbi:MAG: 5-oxoprolinase subunit PxpB [Clostridiaceae bacterium]|nr:5-oxoprolinase subunit PxpB [Clostridiaceae bacterium]
MYPHAKYLLAGDQNIVVEIGNDISIDIHKKVRGLFIALTKISGDEIIEVIPTYRSLLVHYNPLLISSHELIRKIKKIEESLEDMELPPARVVKIPVLYGGEYGPDLEFVAQYNHLTPDEVISIHCSRDYLVYMLGFTPGFCYLGGMSAEIATPRLAEPRTNIPAGSVGIAGNQTGMYPIDSPGGWRIIGRTPVRLFTPENEKQPVLMQAGDYIRYYPITLEEYQFIQKAIEENRYRIEVDSIKKEV